MYKSTFFDYDDSTYYVDSSGVMATGWKKINGYWYYFHDWGGMYKNTFFNYYGETYYVDAEGKMATGWAKIDGVWHYFHDWGGMYKSTFFDYDGETYYVDASGEMAVGWKQINNSWYYFKSWGGMVKNEFVNTNGYKYYLTENGTRAYGQHTINNQNYYFLPTGESSQLQSKNEKHSFSFVDTDGQTGLVTIWCVISEYVATNGKEWKTGDRRGNAYYQKEGALYLTVQASQPRHYNSNNESIKSFSWSTTDDMYPYGWTKMFSSRNLTPVTYGINEKNDSRIIAIAGTSDAVLLPTRSCKTFVNLYY